MQSNAYTILDWDLEIRTGNTKKNWLVYILQPCFAICHKIVEIWWRQTFHILHVSNIIVCESKRDTSSVSAVI